MRLAWSEQEEHDEEGSHVAREVTMVRQGRGDRGRGGYGGTWGQTGVAWSSGIRKRVGARGGRAFNF